MFSSLLGAREDNWKAIPCVNALCISNKRKVVYCIGFRARR